MNKFYYYDFNVMQADVNGHWVTVEELNELVKRGAITINQDKIEQYHNETRIMKV
ncbi:hypothetical protein KQI61_15475 [Anaerocolumna aminovalerica]|uniref:hypothetical protein n=1 Tax=Anaerocolumna aminovalerica TaxID=1527 RepID=UPI001C0F0087|nr:hypothetical protein [Anaerocolumna aminovalerica]MBU5333599.1 hypothetical protein [Anaerocolumna aminovalerica]